MIFSKSKAAKKPVPQPDVTFRTAVDGAIDAAVANFLDKRVIANMLEAAAQRMRVADATLRPW